MRGRAEAPPGVVPAVTRILVADDHELVRRGLRLILDGDRGSRSSRRPATGPGRRAGGLEEVDLAVLDVAMPRMTGLQAARGAPAGASQSHADALGVRQRAVPVRGPEGGASGYVLNRWSTVTSSRRAGRPCGASRSSIRVRRHDDARPPAPWHPPRAPADPAGVRWSSSSPRATRPGRSPRSGDQPADRRPAPGEHPRQARAARPARSHAVRDPPRTRGALTLGNIRLPRDIAVSPRGTRQAGEGAARRGRNRSRDRVAGACAPARAPGPARRGRPPGRRLPRVVGRVSGGVDVFLVSRGSC